MPDSTLAFFDTPEVLGLAGDSGGGRFALFFCDICGTCDEFDFDIGWLGVGFGWDGGGERAGQRNVFACSYYVSVSSLASDLTG